MVQGRKIYRTLVRKRLYPNDTLRNIAKIAILKIIAQIVQLAPSFFKIETADIWVHGPAIVRQSSGFCPALIRMQLWLEPSIRLPCPDFFLQLIIGNEIAFFNLGISSFKIIVVLVNGLWLFRVMFS